MARATAAAARGWRPPAIRRWALNAWDQPVAPVAYYLQGPAARIGDALYAAGFKPSETVDLNHVPTGFGVKKRVSGAFRFLDSVVRLAPKSPERSLFDCVVPAVHRLDGRPQEATWSKDAADGSRLVLRVYARDDEQTQPIRPVTVIRLTGHLKRVAGGTGFLPEVDRRFDLVRDETLDIFSPASIEQYAVAEPWDAEHKDRVVYRLLLE